MLFMRSSSLIQIMSFIVRTGSSLRIILYTLLHLNKQLIREIWVREVNRIANKTYPFKYCIVVRNKYLSNMVKLAFNHLHRESGILIKLLLNPLGLSLFEAVFAKHCWKLLFVKYRFLVPIPDTLNQNFQQKNWKSWVFKQTSLVILITRDVWKTINSLRVCSLWSHIK